MDIEFNSIEELYGRLKPALNAKLTELRLNDLDYIKIEDIWNYLMGSRWHEAKNLLLYQMVDDILNLNNYELDEYVKMRIRNKIVKPNLDDMKWDGNNGKEN